MHRGVAVATWKFGQAAVAASGAALSDGGSAMDAVEAGIRVAELDASEHSVGYGGLPNEDGVVQMDAAVMDGATLDVGAVASLEGVRAPISVARRVMTDSRHVFLVGEGAGRFARKHGFGVEETLTDEARRKWQEWRGSPNRNGDGHDTIGLLSLDADGNLAAGCSTSGVGFKEVGRVGDSPLIGSGLYADNEGGAAAATGLGEEILKFCMSFQVVEFMRAGLPPTEACRAAASRMLARRPETAEHMAAVVALDPQGRAGGYATRDGFSYAVWRDGEATYTEVTVVRA
jgi:L-asparaginase/N4-(beta-N-acetylglucosaminyl)-L-asparaginase